LTKILDMSYSVYKLTDQKFIINKIKLLMCKNINNSVLRYKKAGFFELHALNPKATVTARHSFVKPSTQVRHLMLQSGASITQEHYITDNKYFLTAYVSLVILKIFHMFFDNTLVIQSGSSIIKDLSISIFSMRVL